MILKICGMSLMDGTSYISHQCTAVAHDDEIMMEASAKCLQ